MSNFHKKRAKRSLKQKESFKQKSYTPLNDEQRAQRKKPLDKKTEITQYSFDKEKALALIETLNKEQKEAALSDNDKNLIVASAGTGKTSTIVARVVHLLNNNILPSEIMLITFTSKAAKEMRERITKYIGSEIADDILIGTFHSTAIALLKENNIQFKLITPKGLKNFYSLAYSKYFETASSPDNCYSSNGLFDIYSTYQAKGNGNSFPIWFREAFVEKDYQFDNLNLYEIVNDLYDEILKNENVVGFNELLMLVKDNTSSINKDFKEIIIDEYQDTSFLQNDYVASLKHSSLFCVGDYDQSIYAFNGADISIIGNFLIKYPGASIINLSKNYRSSKPILDFAQKSIEINERLFPKKLEVMKKTHEDVEVQIDKYENQEHQGLEIAKKIIDSNTSFADIAILYRNNSSANIIELSFQTSGIDTIRDDNSSFFEKDEVRYTINLLKLLVLNEKLPFIEILNAFNLNKYSNNIVNTLLHDNPIIKDSILFPKKNYNFSAGNADEYNRKHLSCQKINNSKVGNLLFEIYKTYALYGRLTYKDFIEAFFNAPVITSAMKKFAEDKSIRKGEPDRLLFEKLHARFLSYQKSLKEMLLSFKTLDVFIKSINRGISKKDEDTDAVRLLSIHGSKGLEFNDVYLIDVNDKKFPNERLMKDGGGGIDEERRLFYVSNTRAKNNYFISYCARNDKEEPIEPSEFLVEVGEADFSPARNAKKERKVRIKKIKGDPLALKEYEHILLNLLPNLDLDEEGGISTDDAKDIKKKIKDKYSSVTKLDDVRAWFLSRFRDSQDNN